MISTVDKKTSPSSGTGWRFRRAGGVLAAALLLIVYYSPVRAMMAYWDSSDIYSYGYLVPVISIYFVWLRRRTLQGVPLVPSVATGAATLTAGLLMLVVGRASITNLLEWLSLPVSIIGLSLLIVGAARTRALAFPLVYLFAMIPFWDFVLVPLQAPFQLYSAALGVSALRLAGIPVLRDGIFIHLPNCTLEVAEVCSGVNQLVAILCIGVPAAHLRMRSWAKRVAIVLIAGGIALLSNGVRVAVLSLMAYRSIIGPDFDIHGPYSVLRTMAISALGFVVLFWLIARFSDSTFASADPDPSNRVNSAPAPAWLPASSLAVRVAIVLLLGAAWFQLWHRVTAVQPTAPLASLPTTLAGWTKVADLSAPAGAKAVGFDQLLTRRYLSPDGRQVAELLIGYFESQRQGHELVGYESSLLLSNAADSRDQQFTHWYVVNGRNTTEGYAAKWWTAWDSVTRRSNSGAMVIVRTTTSGLPPDEARARLAGLLDALADAMSRQLRAV